MSMATAYSEKSTTVRFPRPGESGSAPDVLPPNGRHSDGTPRWRVATALLRWFPGLSGAVLAQLFLTPRRRRHRVAPAQLPAQSTSVDVAGRRVRVRVAGTGPVVLVVHGWGGGASQLGRIADELVEAGFSVAQFDMPAHGETRGATTSLPQFIETVRKVASRFDSVHAIVAHSLGATAAVLATQRDLDVQGLALVAPMPSFDFALDEFSRILGLSQETREDVAVRIERRVGMKRPEGNLHAVDPLPHTLLVHDVDDRAIPVTHSRSLAERWRRAGYLETRGLGHNRLLDDTDVIGAVRRFVEQIPTRRPTEMDAALGQLPQVRL